MSKRPQPQLDAIGDAAESAQAEAAAASPDERLTKLEEQISKLEPLLEQQQRVAAHSLEMAEYLSQLRSEQGFMNIARYVMSGAVLIVVILLIVLLILALVHRESPLLSAPPAAIAVFMVGIISGIVILTLNLVKGVFRTAAERHNDGLLPQQVSTLVELWEKIRGP